MTVYMKLIRNNRKHHGLCIHEGLNCLKETEIFNELHEGGPGGLYFCKEENVGHWLHKDIGFIATVTLCHDSKIVTMDTNRAMKTDRYILGPFQPLKEWFTVERAMAAIKQNGCALQYIPETFKTVEICSAAVQMNYNALYYVPIALKTPDMCLAVVKLNGRMIDCVPFAGRTSTICLAAVQQCGIALVSVPNRTPDICLAAVQQAGMALGLIPSDVLTTDMCAIAYQQNNQSYAFIPSKIRKELFYDMD